MPNSRFRLARQPAPTAAVWHRAKRPHPRLLPGNCPGKVHQRETLGFTGRRVLISRQWSGKTLTDHREDNRAWVKALLALGNPIQTNNKAATTMRGSSRGRGNPNTVMSTSCVGAATRSPP